MHSDFEWLIDSSIRSRCDDGRYTAGINFDKHNPATDVMTVVDHANGDITAVATITVYSSCPAIEFYGRNSGEVAVLRKFRNGVLSSTSEGRQLIKIYYKWSPVFVRAIEADEDFKEEVKEMVDDLLPMIEELVD
jgi:hypothetical protein